MVILGIETSCDETAAAILEEKSDRLSVLSSIVSSQTKLHARWGGVVPNLAAREHLKNISPVIDQCLKKSRVRIDDIDLISVTSGPGLIPALLIGTTAAKTLSYLWKKPLIGIHHIEGHIYANFINIPIFPTKKPADQQNREAKNMMEFPILCLVVSGGHTLLVLMEDHFKYKIVGETLDDAAGEAFDKVARILGLGYPGGPVIAKIADSFKSQSKIYQLSLPRPMINAKNFNFSFSGLKTAVLYLAKKNESLLSDKRFIEELCFEFQQAAIDVLIYKTISAAKIYKPKTVMLAGGVSANKDLRYQLAVAIKKELENTLYVIPNTRFSIDNAAMIAAAGYYRYVCSNGRRKFINNWKTLRTDADLKFEK